MLAAIVTMLALAVVVGLLIGLVDRRLERTEQRRVEPAIHRHPAAQERRAA